MNRNFKKRLGFTLVEVVTVVALLAVLTLVATPAVAGFVQNGQQTNRSNVARTLYVATQNRLTELRVSQNLRPTLTEQYYLVRDQEGLDPAKLELHNVSTALGGQFPTADDGNQDYVRYISKPRGTPEADDPVVKLLDPVVVDKSLLYNAITIEYNIKTAVVLSVFYSETAQALVYDDAAADQNTNILGPRPYTLAADRKQGYYGVDSTGVAYQPPLPDVTEIYDGGLRPLETRKNVLYAEIFLPKGAPADPDPQRVLELTGVKKKPLYTTGSPVTMPRDGTLDSGLGSPVDGKHILYRSNDLTGTAPAGSVVQYSIDLSASYDRYIWVIDYVGGDQLRDQQPHSIQNKYKQTIGNTPIPAQDLRVRVSASGGSASTAALSLSKAHSLYQNQGQGLGKKSYSVSTGRHLSNVRYVPDGEFRQTEDISLSQVTNFDPIPTFTGKYVAIGENDRNLQIQDLTINTSGIVKAPDNVGLFGVVGDADKDGGLYGIALNRASITATANNVGGLAGELRRGTISRCSSLGNVEAQGSSNLNVGGLVGFISSASSVLDQSYNGGYYDATGQVTVADFGYVYGSRGNIGGLAGQSVGTIQNCYNNARVNIIDAQVDQEGIDRMLSKNPVPYSFLSYNYGYLGGIVGYNSGTVKTCYATNHVAQYGSPSRSGGIVGNSPNTGKAINCFYLNNGVSNIYGAAKTKTELWTTFVVPDSAFVRGNPNYVQGKNTAADYPYPVLVNNQHITGYEDIWEKPSIPGVWLSYYEYYQDQSWGYSYAPSLPPAAPSPSSTLKDDKTDPLVVTEGYCLDLGYNESYEITLKNGSSTVTYRLTNTVSNTDNPEWEWEWGGSDDPPLLPVAYTFQGEGYTQTRYRIILNNGLMEALAKGNQPLSVTVSAQNVTLLTDSFDPRFAQAFGTGFGTAGKPYEVRSPRHLDNVDLVAFGQSSSGQTPQVDSHFSQTLDLDFGVYYKELEAEKDSLSPNKATKLEVTGSVVNAQLTGSYQGRNHFIRNLEMDADKDDDESPLTGRGLFAEIGQKGVVRQVALLNAHIGGMSGGKRALGGIAGVVQSGGTIESCELSQVTIADQATNIVGGVAGINYGTVRYVYFNSALRDNAGVYQTPITGGKDAILGGLVGENRGKLSTSYNTAVGPAGADGKPRPCFGRNTNGIIENACFLSTTNYNAGAPTIPSQLLDLAPNDRRWDTIFRKGASGFWSDSTLQATKETNLCYGMAYQYPQLKGMDHHYDWPILIPYLKYYERYSDLSYGYYYYKLSNSPAVDTLRYDPGLTVIEEGYLLEVQTKLPYTIKIFDNAAKNTLIRTLPKTDPVSMDGRLVIKLPHDEMEALMNRSAAVVNGTGMRPLRIQASSSEPFKNELTDDTSGAVWLNPLFAKSIYLTNNPNTIPTTPGTTLEVRSPRQLLNINRKFGDPAHEFMIGYHYLQTIDLDMTTQSGAGSSAPYYSRSQDYSNLDSRPKLPDVGRNVVAGLTGSYNGAYAGGYAGQKASDTGRLLGYRIKNLVMHVAEVEGQPYNTIPKNDGHIVQNGYALRYADSTGSTFGDVSGTVKNLNFADPQIRYEANGMGGGIVANVNSGIIDNVNVYNTEKRQLFTDANGNTDTKFCARLDSTTVFPESAFSHAHGGISGITIGKGAKVINCIVGTNSADIGEIADNKVQITCYSEMPDRKKLMDLNDKGLDVSEYRMGMVGGITGVLTGDGLVQSCVNIATIQPHMPTINANSKAQSMFMAGGIVGRVGNADQGYIMTHSPALEFSRGDIVGCYNAGTIILPHYYVGGIVGRTAGVLDDKSYSRVVSCYNTGRINAREVSGVITAVPYVQKDSTAELRLGGICGEADATKFQNCYNIGYVSNLTGETGADSSGAIVGLPTYTNNIVEYCYSLFAGEKQLRPNTIVGRELYRGAQINGITDKTLFKTLFEPFWETRANLRENTVMTNKQYDNVWYPGNPNDLFSGLTGTKPYPVLVNSSATNRNYIYPQFPSNPHITPFEYIDSMYETTLKYYERYDNKVTPLGLYYLDLQGQVQNTLQQDKAVVLEDGYLLEVGINDTYTVEISNSTDTVTIPGISSVPDIFGQADKYNIPLTDEVLQACKPGEQNRIRVYTQLTEDTPQNIEDNKLNRILGSRSVLDQEGIDLYFDPLFPREQRFSTLAPDGTFPVPTRPAGPYAIRSPRQLESIGKLAQAADQNLTIGKTFQQELNIDFSKYRYPTSATPPAGYDKNTGIYARSPVLGSFRGIYQGDNKALSHLTIQGGPEHQTLGLFEENAGTIGKLALVDSAYTSIAANKLTMGAVAGSNDGGTIRNVAVTGFTLTGSGAPDQQIGGLVGSNAQGGQISDVYLLSNNDTDNPPITTTGTGDRILLGGVAGHNNAQLLRILYLAPAPGSTPISGNPISGTGSAVETYYLGGIKEDGKDYNHFDVGETGGLAKSTVQLQEFRDSMSQGWTNAGWESSGTYPYPSLKGLTPPLPYPQTKDIPYQLAYREAYTDGTFGFYYGKDDPNNSLFDNKTITNADYVVVVPEQYKDVSLTLRLENIAKTMDPVADSDNRLLLPLPAYDDGGFPFHSMTRVTVNGFEMANGISYCDRAFAKALATKKESASFSTYFIRTPEQMLQIGQMTTVDGKSPTKDKIFTQELPLDFSGHPLTQSVVPGEFLGEYNGKGITNLTIHADDSPDPVGIFSINSGKLNGVALGASSLIQGKNEVGGITGRNTVTGRISDSMVEGQEAGAPGLPDYNGLQILGEIYVGGIAGVNEGKITDSTVWHLTGVDANNLLQPTTWAIRAAVDYVGGIAGLNEVKGTITDCKLDYVSIDVPPPTPITSGQYHIVAPNRNIDTSDPFQGTSADPNTCFTPSHEPVATLTVLLEGRMVAQQSLIPPRQGDLDLELVVDTASPVPGISDVVPGISSVLSRARPRPLFPGLSGLFPGLSGLFPGLSGLPLGLSNLEAIPPQEVLILLDDLREGYELTAITATRGDGVPLTVVQTPDGAAYRFVVTTAQSSFTLAFAPIEDEAAARYTCTISLYIL